MISYDSKVVIGRPPEVVFGYLIDPAKQALWSGVPMRQLTSGPLQVGSRLEISFGTGLMKAVIGLELSSVEQDRAMSFTTFSGPIKWDGGYRLFPTDSGGTEVSQHGTLEFTGFWRGFEAMAGTEISRGEVKELEKLKAVVEAS